MTSNKDFDGIAILEKMVKKREKILWVFHAEEHLGHNKLEMTVAIKKPAQTIEIAVAAEEKRDNEKEPEKIGNYKDLQIETE